MRKRFLVHILLVFIWLALTGDYSWINILLGSIIGFFALWQANRTDTEERYFKFVPRAISFVFFFLYELTKANIQVAYEVISPPLNMKPGIIEYPLSVKSDLEITFLANVISLTPGTFSLDVSADKKMLYIHAMYIYDRDDFINSIKNGFEQRIIDLFE